MAQVGFVRHADGPSADLACEVAIKKMVLLPGEFEQELANRIATVPRPVVGRMSRESSANTDSPRACDFISRRHFPGRRPVSASRSE